MVKKISLGMNAEDFTVEKMAETVPQARSSRDILTDDFMIPEFAIAALKSLNWNQIGLSVDEAAQLCWKMAEAMVRHKP